jgi:hypothetical protein
MRKSNSGIPINGQLFKTKSYFNFKKACLKTILFYDINLIEKRLECVFIIYQSMVSAVSGSSMYCKRENAVMTVSIQLQKID